MLSGVFVGVDGSGRAGSSNAEKHVSVVNVRIIPWIGGEVHFPLGTDSQALEYELICPHLLFK